MTLRHAAAIQRRADRNGRAASATSNGGAKRSLIETPRDRPIGVFDSGIGGLTVLKSLIEVLPG